jgi:hypothetical protein
VLKLQEEFVSGKTPKKLDGFYNGRLEEIINTNFIETLAKISVSVFLPWKGKWFNAKNNMGDNILPSFLVPFLKLKIGKDFEIKKEFGGAHVFPFKTSIQKGLKDNITVLRLDYNIPKNPLIVRKVVDELVEVGKDSYLGKAHIHEDNSFRTVAFFSLDKMI